MPNNAPNPAKANAKNSNVNSEIRSYPFIAENLSYPYIQQMIQFHTAITIRKYVSPIILCYFPLKYERVSPNPRSKPIVASNPKSVLAFSLHKREWRISPTRSAS